LPIKPMSGCAAVPGDGMTQGVRGIAGAEIGTEHGVEIMLTCAEGFDAVNEPAPVCTCPEGMDVCDEAERIHKCKNVDFRDPAGPTPPPSQPPLQPEGKLAAVQEVKLQCKHGHWETMDGDRNVEETLSCNKACPPYFVEGISLLDKRALRERDFIVSGDPITKERHHYHSAKVTVSCPEGYGVVIGEERSKETGYEVLYCNEGTWENQFGLTKYTETGPMTMECSVCYDAYAHEWTDEKGNTCLYYKSRPMECNENQGAIDNCRVSCRSCMQAEELYKVKNTVDNLFDIPVENRGNWNRVREWVPVQKHRIDKVPTNVKVTVQLTMDQVCTDGLGNNIRKNEDGTCDGAPEFYPMA